MSPRSLVSQKWGEEMLGKETSRGLGDLCSGGEESNLVALAANKWQLSGIEDPAPSPLSVHPASSHQIQPLKSINAKV